MRPGRYGVGVGGQSGSSEPSTGSSRQVTPGTSGGTVTGGVVGVGAGGAGAGGVGGGSSVVTAPTTPSTTPAGAVGAGAAGAGAAVAGAGGVLAAGLGVAAAWAGGGAVGRRSCDDEPERAPGSDDASTTLTPRAYASAMAITVRTYSSEWL